VNGLSILKNAQPSSQTPHPVSLKADCTTAHDCARSQ